MKIAATYDGGIIFQHFGKTQFFKIYTADKNGDICNVEIVSSNGQGHGALADILKEMNIDALICGGIGAGAVNALTEKGIEVYGGNSGNPDALAIALLAGRLEKKSVSCNHHHEGEHDCGEHKCN